MGTGKKGITSMHRGPSQVGQGGQKGQGEGVGISKPLSFSVGQRGILWRGGLEGGRGWEGRASSEVRASGGRCWMLEHPLWTLCLIFIVWNLLLKYPVCIENT